MHSEDFCDVAAACLCFLVFLCSFLFFGVAGELIWGLISYVTMKRGTILDKV